MGFAQPEVGANMRKIDNKIRRGEIAAYKHCLNMVRVCPCLRGDKWAKPYLEKRIIKEIKTRGNLLWWETGRIIRLIKRKLRIY